MIRLFATTKEMTKLPSKLARKPLDFSPDLSADEQLAEDLAGFYADPLGYVMYCLPWDEERSIQVVVLQSPFKERFPGALCKTSTCPFHEKVGDHAHGPDVWACEFLDELGEEIRKRGFDGANAVSPIRFSTVSGHDIGKSALTAWLIKFILDTRPMSVGTVTAMTAEQLKNKTWAELGKWHKMSLTSHWFDYTSGRGAMALSSNRADKYGNSLREQWKCTAQTCREENSEAFAGQHAVNSTSFYIFDEASGVPNKIFEVRDGGTTDGEPMVFDFGNPTRNSGRFFEQCQGRLRHRYIVRSIDSRDVAITNKALHQEWIDDYGIEDDYVKVRILGQFPSAGSVQFIPTSLVEEAMKRVRAAIGDSSVTEPGPASLEIAVRATYPLVVSRRLSVIGSSSYCRTCHSPSRTRTSVSTFVPWQPLATWGRHSIPRWLPFRLGWLPRRSKTSSSRVLRLPFLVRPFRDIPRQPIGTQARSPATGSS
ncbi:hypothetical protein LCGC14_1373970 [marine sediment metagenome]|uniref:Uncharacterized protein n=1 Tax=marine sediment metagenome TaxID=412755 RepID=A0A0F9N6K2_9ZZZZ